MRGDLIGEYLRASAASGEHERVGPFLVRYTASSDHPMLNYAVPDDGARATPEMLEQLAGAFERRGLLARLEYATDSAPGLEVDLLAAGFSVERRLPVLLCEPRKAPAVPRLQVQGFDVFVASSGRDHAEAIMAADEAYGEPVRPPSESQVAARHKLSAQGGVVVLARERRRARPAGCGMLGVPRAGVSELAGVGTKPEFRRLGIASAVVAKLLEHAVRASLALVWLTPEDEAAERVYTRAGFERSAEQVVHLGRPRPAGAGPP